MSVSFNDADGSHVPMNARSRVERRTLAEINGRIGTQSTSLVASVVSQCSALTADLCAVNVSCSLASAGTDQVRFRDIAAAAWVMPQLSTPDRRILPAGVLFPSRHQPQQPYSTSV